LKGKLKNLLAACLAMGACLTLGCHADSPAPAGFDNPEKNVVELQQAMNAGTLTAEQLVIDCLRRIEAYDDAGPGINALISMNPHALDEALALDDERRASGARRGWLHGIPLVVKDSIDAQGMATTNGSISLLNMFPVDDSFVVRRLREAGAIILGKANQDELQFGGWGLSASGGQTRNPYHPECVPSGSSGGTGAAVAAGFAVAGLGADHAGSIRNPSAANNLYGLRPTLGLSSREGAWSGSRYVNVIGPMTRTPTDMAALLDAIAGYDPADEFTAAGIGKVPESYMAFLDVDGLTGKRIGYVTILFDPDRYPGCVQPECVLQSRGALEIMDAEGASMVPLEFHRVVSNQIFQTLSSLAADKLDSLNEYFRSNPVTDFSTYCEFVLYGDHFSAMPAYYGFIARIGLWPTCILPPPSEEEMQKARQMQVDRQEELLALMDKHRLDAIVLGSTQRKLMPISYIWEGFPTLCENAPELEDEGMQLAAISSVTGFPVLIVPVGLTLDRHPVSIQVMGRPFSEPYLISLAQSFAKAYRRHTGTSNHSRPASTPPLPCI